MKTITAWSVQIKFRRNTRLPAEDWCFLWHSVNDQIALWPTRAAAQRCMKDHGVKSTNIAYKRVVKVIVTIREAAQAEKLESEGRKG